MECLCNLRIPVIRRFQNRWRRPPLPAPFEGPPSENYLADSTHTCAWWSLGNVWVASTLLRGHSDAAPHSLCRHGKECDRPGHCPAQCSTSACTLSVQYRTWRQNTGEKV